MCVHLCKTQKVSQSNCFVTHWAAEMRFLNWWSSFGTPYFKPKKDIYRFLAPTAAENDPLKRISLMSKHCRVLMCVCLWRGKE